MVVEVTGDILDAKESYIAHGVNCQSAMGSGVAKAIYTKWPLNKRTYHKYCSLFHSNMLGDLLYVPVSDEMTIINCFTQQEYGYTGDKFVSYDAIHTCFSDLSKQIPLGTEVAIPKIGCGLAGGSWNVVKAIIEDATDDRINITVYSLGE